MNCLCIKRGILRHCVFCWLRFGNYRTKEIPCQMWENFFTILRQWAALERPTFPVNRWLFWVPEPCRVAILDCRVIHKIVWTLQETFLNDHLLKKDDPPQFSTIQRILHHPLRNWHLKLPEQQGRESVKWKENRWIRRFPYTISKVEVVCCFILVELIRTVVWWIIRDFRFRKCILENFLTLWNFKASKSTSRMPYVQGQRILRSLCIGSQKLRLQCHLTNLWHRDLLWSEQISLTSICLIRLLC